MNSPIEDLKQEHAGIILMLSVMTKVAEKIYRGEDVDKNHLRKITEFLKNFADKCHHGKEEGILFPELMKTTADKKLINELLGEHKSGRDYIRGIAESLEQSGAGNPDAVHIAVNAHGYVRLLTEHIKKENSVLFPEAGKILKNETMNEIGERFEKLEHDVIGEGKHEEYHSWLKELRSIYLTG